MAVTIYIPSSQNGTPLYHQYPTQSGPQGAFLEINPSENSARWCWNQLVGGGDPGEVILVHCSNNLSECQIEELTERLRPCIEQVCAASQSDGDWDDEAAEALETIADELANEDGEEEVWDALEWLYPSVQWQKNADGETIAVVIEELIIRGDMTRQEVHALDSALHEMAADEDVALSNVDGAIEHFQQQCTGAPDADGISEDDS